MFDPMIFEVADPRLGRCFAAKGIFSQLLTVIVDILLSKEGRLGGGISDDITHLAGGEGFMLRK